MLYNDNTLRKKTIESQRRPNDSNSFSFYLLLQCFNCGTATMREELYRPEEPDSDHVKYHPPRVERTIPKELLPISNFTFDMLEGLPHAQSDQFRYITHLLGDVYGSLASGYPRVAMMGVRSIMEAALADKLKPDDVWGLDGKVKQAVAKGIISSDQASQIEAVFNAGNNVTHRYGIFHPELVRKALDIVEPHLQLWYIASKSSEILNDNIPPKSPKVSK